nr:PREDICTED: uncharacterized protein LOC109036523 [Bemisia tabaci]
MVCWSIEEEFLLINLYEKFPVLWNSESDTQTSIKKYEAWSEIATTLGRSVKEIQKKMGSLKNLLNWEKAMIKKLSQPETGQHHKYFSTLFAFRRMNFLTDGNALQEAVNTDTAKSDDFASGKRVPDGDNDDTRFERNHEPETSAPTNVTPNCASTPSTLKEHIANLQSCFSISSMEPVTGACPDTVDNFSIASMKDESDYFGSYVAGKLRNFDRRVRAELEHQITQVLLRVETGDGSLRIASFLRVFLVKL